MGRKKGVIFSYIFMATEAVSSMLFTPFVIRCLGAEEYGIYGLVASITSYLYLLDLGVGNAIVRYMVKFHANNDKKNEQNVLAITMVFYSIIVAVIILAGQLLNYFIPTLFGDGLTAEQHIVAQKMLNITVLTAAATLFFAPLKKTLIAYERFATSKSIDIFKVMFKIILGFVVLLSGGKGVAVVAVNLIVTVAAGLVETVYVFGKIKLFPKYTKPEKGFISSIVGFSSFIMIQMIATQINAMVGQVLIGMFVSSSAVILALYTAGTQITTYYQSFGSTINGVLMPGVTRMIEQKATTKEIQNEMVKVSRLLFAFLGIIFVGFLVCGKEFMVAWAGEGYEKSYYVAIILMIPMLFSLAQSIGTQVLWAMDKHKEQSILKLAISVVATVIIIVLIQWDGLLGATIGTAFAYLVGDVVVMNIIFKKHIKISVKGYWFGMFKGILPCLIISGVVGFLVSLTNLSGWSAILVEGGCTCIAYGISMLIFGMNTYEKNLLTKIPMVKKFIKI